MSEARYQLVESLYGPGTAAGWLLTICSVLLSWLFNPRLKKVDHITNDFIATLTLPFIASAHVIFQLLRLPATPLEVFTSLAPEMVQRAAAIAAPLNICQTFSIFALLLFAISAWRLQVKRAALVFVAGVLSWATVNAVFVAHQASQTQHAVLGNQDSYPTVISVVRRTDAQQHAFLGNQDSYPTVISVRRTDAHQQSNFEMRTSDKFALGIGLGAFIFSLLMFTLPVLLLVRRKIGNDSSPAENQEMDSFQRRTTSSIPAISRGIKRAWMKSTAFISGLSTPIAFGVAILMSTGVLTGEGFTLKYQPFFIPKTSTSTRSLDQLVALAGGGITFLFSVFDAVTETRGSSCTTQEETHVMASLGRPGSGAVHLSDPSSDQRTTELRRRSI
jgi:hypothetical protein